MRIGPEQEHILRNQKAILGALYILTHTLINAHTSTVTDLLGHLAKRRSETDLFLDEVTHGNDSPG